ncbi:MAG: VCBS repeat-containing protein [Planctomycetes bacterium]|nr:VCBS repeat-containing protein [Planctomycetota bacterium]
MSRAITFLIGAGLVFLITSSGDAAAQQFTPLSAASIPPLGGDTESVKFGDFDLDGDLDLVYANGGDSGNQQSRVLFNRGLSGTGGLPPGSLGTFGDVTATHLAPNFTQSSRDVQVVDIDGDGDLDLFFANNSQIISQSNTWWINQGLAQAGTAGVFVQDSSRWLGLGSAGSSVPSSLLLTAGPFAGGFVDFSAQGDFADVDFDGDPDYYHTSYGSGFSGAVMSRLFLNESGPGGWGWFREYNPSGAVAPSASIPNGSAAGFLEGVQAEATLLVDGTTHDISNMPLDVDFCDLDGDFDLDIYANSRSSRQRFYQSRWVENGESLGSESLGKRLYRDRTGIWGAQVPQQLDNYDGELGDLDFDNDCDAYFLNGAANLSDSYALNDGTGSFGLGTALTDNRSDNEVDLLDFDHDGDLDVFVSAFSSTDRFYKNQFLELASVALVPASAASGAGTLSLAADMGDIDNDGDTDILSAQRGTASEVLLVNGIGAPDPIAPRIPLLRALSDGPAQVAPRRVLVRAFDNAAHETFKTATGTVNFSVNGDSRSAVLSYSGGDTWRGEIPGYLHGSISYQVIITDRAGNVGSSASATLSVSSVGLASVGLGVPGCAGAHMISAASSPAIGNPEFEVRVTACPPSSTQLMLVSSEAGTGLDELGIGIPMHVSLFAPELYAFDLPVNGSGVGALSIAIPNVPELAGRSYYWMSIHANTACTIAPFQLSSSAALVTTLFL